LIISGVAPLARWLGEMLGVEANLRSSLLAWPFGAAKGCAHAREEVNPVPKGGSSGGGGGARRQLFGAA